MKMLIALVVLLVQAWFYSLGKTGDGLFAFWIPIIIPILRLHVQKLRARIHGRLPIVRDFSNWSILVLLCERFNVHVLRTTLLTHFHFHRLLRMNTSGSTKSPQLATAAT